MVKVVKLESLEPGYRGLIYLTGDGHAVIGGEEAVEAEAVLRTVGDNISRAGSLWHAIEIRVRDLMPARADR